MNTMHNETKYLIKPAVLAPLSLMILTLILFGDVLFSTGGRVLSSGGTDLSHQFLYWRDFASREILRGNFPLWNPHLFSGAPFFGGFQSALLYPPNVLFLILPLGPAINVSIALHVFLMGWFTYLWISHRGIHPLAGLTSSVLMMLSGSYFWHIFAGHLPNLCVMPWIPLFFLSLDGLIMTPSRGWTLLGIFALSMEILAGHPQYVYYTAMMAVPYLLFHIQLCLNMKRTILGLAFICAGSLLIPAVQITSGFEASLESVRSYGTSWSFATMFSFPPENFLTFLAPKFFGDIMRLPYWGRNYLWEMCPFVGVTGLLCALYSAVFGQHRRSLPLILLTLLAVVLALGDHTPVYSILYHYLPGFSQFRGTSKFIFFASLFIVHLAGMGFHKLLLEKRVHPYMGAASLTAAVILIVVVVVLYSQVSNHTYFKGWDVRFHYLAESGESYLAQKWTNNSQFIEKTIYFAAGQLRQTALILFSFTLLATASYYFRASRYLIICLAWIEMILFAATIRPTFQTPNPIDVKIASFIARHPGDYRVLNIGRANSAMSTGTNNIWGYDPIVPLRYARFMASTQEEDPEKASQYLNFRRYDRLYEMLRLKFLITVHGNAVEILEYKNYMPRFNLINQFEVIHDWHKILHTMYDPSFNPRKTVILEQEPLPFQDNDKGSRGSIKLLENSTNYSIIEISAGVPSILLVTDNYSRAWHAIDLTNRNMRYTVLPANYTLMAIPLGAGRHLIRLEYKPFSFTVSLWLSLASLSVYVLVLITWFARRVLRGDTNS
jgi:hypothetical protein